MQARQDKNLAPSIQEVWSVPTVSLAQLRKWMTAYAAIVRDEKGLQTLLDHLEQVSFQQINVKNITNEQIEITNQWALAICLVKSALPEQKAGAVIIAQIILIGMMLRGEQNRLYMNRAIFIS